MLDTNLNNDNFKDEVSRSGHTSSVGGGGGGGSGFENLMDDDSVSSSGVMEESSSSKSSNIGTSSNPDRSTTNTSSDNDGEGRTTIAKDETAAVFRLRVIVIIVLIITASVVSAVVLSITQRGEMDELETQYEGSAYIVQVAFQDIMEDLSILSALAVVDDEFAAAIDDDDDDDDDESNNNNNSQQTTTTTKGFPFQTLENFNKRAANARYMTGALSISMCPIVTIDKRETWEEYVLEPENNYWMSSALEYQERMGLNDFETNEQLIGMSYVTNNTVDPIKFFDQRGQAHLSLNDGPYLPVWQTSPVLSRRIVNENTFSRTTERQVGLAVNAISTQQAILGGFVTAQYGDPSNPDPTTSLFATYRSIKEENSTRYLGDPLSYFYLPIFDFTKPDHHHHLASSSSSSSTTPTSDNDTDTSTTTSTTTSPTSRVVVGVLQSLIEWRGYFRNMLKDDIPPIIVILENSCGGQYTYELQGQEAYIVGHGDHHDPSLDHWEISSTFTTNHLRDGTVEGIYVNQQYGCQYSVRIYPTQQFMDKYNTDTPLAITFAIAVVFVFTICMFILYDRLVEQRQNIVMAQAAHTTAIVSSLFPKNVRDRLLAPADLRRTGGGSIFSVNKSRLKGFLDDGDSQGENDSDDAPIADLFPECTVFFADIAGFTAWSSTREPEQVFVLLQTVYQKFDILAKRRRVFKVETIGDSYMAVTGLPEPMVNHAVTMVRFAWDCRNEFHRVTKELECQLGPDTADLAMRFGLHSGPVTAGVLRGDRARFQLFGDTVNTASRMESTGMRDRVQLSSSTAELVRLAGKETWLKQREDEVHAKGKGSLVTYWANPKTSIPSSCGGSSSQGGLEEEDNPAQIELRPQPSYNRVNQRLVDWMTDLLLDQTKKIVYSRRKNKGKPTDEAPTYFPQEGMTCMDEVKEQIEMPTYDAKSTDSTGREYRNVRINSEVVANLREYVSRIAETYRDNSFHNFEHACHVTMSVNKLLKRIVAPELSHEEIERLQKVDDMAAHLHDYTHGINGDPLLAFAITISALIHDVDHRGVSNTRLIEEEPEMASKYHDKSVAEQNSLDIAWAILMEDGFEQLRRVLFPTHFDLMRFRQLIVNVVLATDIMDKELNGLRKRRWERAFSEESKEENTNDTNLRATIVIEHIIQASDVSHTMQHWHVYRKWNERLFQEVYKAYLDGRMEKDPSEGWYKGEIGFFDFYIIPLAKKLKECGVFGVSSDEYLNYAQSNRREWEQKGEDIVKKYIQKYTRDYQTR